MPHNIETHDMSDSTGPTRRSSVAATLADQNFEGKTSEYFPQNAESVVEEEKPKKKTNLFVVFSGLQLSLFLAALDSTIVAPALPRIGSDFNQMTAVSWVATAYILTFDVFQPLFAKFSDIFGRKLILMFGIVVFLIGSLLCGVANSMIMLIISRAIAGIGGAGIFSMVFIIISDLVPLEQRGSYQGVVNSVFALSSVCGPLIGGSFTDYVTWRWNFYINLPIGAVAMVLLFVFLKMPVPQGNLKEKLKRIDYLGAVIVLVFATLFLLAMNFGGQLYPWKSAAVIVPLILSALLVIALVYVENKVEEPLMPPRLFKNVSVASVLATNWFFGMTFFSMIYYLPIYFQVVRGDSAMWSGIRLIPMEMMIAVFSTCSGVFISKKGIFKPLLPIGMSLLTICVGLISLFGEDTSYSMIYGCTVIGGTGMGFMFSSAIIALQACAEPKDLGVVTGLGNFTRILGGALGVAIASAILNSSLAKELPKHVPADIVQNVLASSEYVRHGCPPEYFEIVLASYLEALHLIWYIITAMCGIGFCCSLNVRNARVLATSEEEEMTLEKTETPPLSSAEYNRHPIDEAVVSVNMEPAKDAIEPHHGADMNNRKS
ncbi:major facilitator superfamily domain-containing protein [Helicostylum pulchrum]|nr:major facilitator superfamily domain-containing protein [Helicostylum pulchrum]